jgi:asparagine synthase (glutamine-hydrolysing)
MMPLVSYELMRLAKSNGIKVVLNGQGADETIAGYPSYFGHYWTNGLQKGDVSATWRQIGEYAAKHGGSHTRSFLRHLTYAARARFARIPFYRTMAAWRRRQVHRSSCWYTADLASYLSSEPVTWPSTLHESLLYSVYRTPLPRILRVEDRNSMAHSIEARLPFLDYRLAEFCFGLAPEWLLRGPWNKYVLRQAMNGRIPESVRTRVDKMGFPVPSKDWLSGPLYEPVLDLLNSRKTRERGIYKVDSILRDMEGYRRGRAPFPGPVFDIAQFEVWSAL